MRLLGAVHSITGHAICALRIRSGEMSNISPADTSSLAASFLSRCWDARFIFRSRSPETTCLARTGNGNPPCLTTCRRNIRTASLNPRPHDANTAEASALRSLSIRALTTLCFMGHIVATTGVSRKKCHLYKILIIYDIIGASPDPWCNSMNPAF
jgi:hypothetical protein